MTYTYKTQVGVQARVGFIILNFFYGRSLSIFPFFFVGRSFPKQFPSVIMSFPFPLFFGCFLLTNLGKDYKQNNTKQLLSCKAPT